MLYLFFNRNKLKMNLSVSQTSLASEPGEAALSSMKNGYLDFPPPELLIKPMPCIVLTGLDAAHNPAHKAITEILTVDRKSDRLPINYIARPVEHEYPKAKPRKSSYEWYVPRGILKTYWMRKHLTEVPSVVVIFYNFDWITDPQWREKQVECQTLVRTVQSNLVGRSTKIVLVVIQEGASLPPGGDAISEERCALLCAACGLQLQNSLFILQNNEQLQGCCLKLESRLYEIAQSYYVNETRKVKEHREFLNKTTHQLLFVRHHFKTAFLSEFMRPPDGIQAALRNYRQAFGHLIDVRATDYNLHEIKIIAGFISYKIWALSLLPGSNTSQRDAESHFRKHVEWLRLRVGQPELAVEHFAWLASQYRMFADLFAEAVRSAGFTASISQHPGIYYHQAAILTRERRRAITLAQTPQLPKPGTILANGAVVLEGAIPQLSPMPQSEGSPNPQSVDFFGQRAWRPGYQSLEPPDAVTESVGIAGLQAVERTTVDHSAIVTSLLSFASVHFRKLGSSRMCTRLSWETANELMLTFNKTPANVSIAISMLKTVITEYRRDQWADLLRIALLRQLECARFSHSNSEGFDVDYVQELAAICFELAALPSPSQISALDALVAFVTHSDISDRAASLFSPMLVEAWHSHVSASAKQEAPHLNLDVSVLGNSAGLVQSWAHFPATITTLDQLPKLHIYVRKVSAANDQKTWKFLIQSVGLHLHFYYFYKSKNASGSAAMARATTKTLDVAISEPGHTSAELSDISHFSCEISSEEANRVVAAAVASMNSPSATSNARDDGVVLDFNSEAFVAISGWWVDVLINDELGGKQSGRMRLNWTVGEEPSPPTIAGSSLMLHYPLTGRDLLKLRQRNFPPKWIASSASGITPTTATNAPGLYASPFICCLKPKQAHIVMTVDNSISPALVGERYPVLITLKNMSSEVSTADMHLEVFANSSNPQNLRACLLSAGAGENSQPTDHLVVKIPSIPPGSHRSLPAFIVNQATPDVLSISMRLKCDTLSSTDDAVVEVVKHAFSLPVILPFSLVSSNLLDFDSLTPVQSYCPHRHTVLSVRLSSSSPHDLELISLKFRSKETGEISDCIALKGTSAWPRHLKPGTSFVEGFSLRAIRGDKIPSASLMGNLTLLWRRRGPVGNKEGEPNSSEIPSVELKISLPEVPVQPSSVVIRMVRKPSRAVLYKPCVVGYSVSNVTRSTLSLRISVQVAPAPAGSNSSAPLLISGSSDVSVMLIPGASTMLPVSFLPLVAGFITLPRLRISASTTQPITSSVADPLAANSQLGSEVTDTMSPNVYVFVQTAPGIEWLLPGTANPTL